MGWGLGAWGLGSLAYNSGYLGYYNPYYVSGGYSGFNYSQPVPVIYSDVPATSNDQTADALLDSAIAAFQQNDYDRALDIVNKGISQYPSDSVLHEFRALILFAKADYQQAASTIHSVLAVGPGWNWATLGGLYTDVAIYTRQLRALEAFARQNPDDAGSRFLLAYHYMAGDHQDAAARKLQDVVRLSPEDRVAADLLAMMTHPAGSQTQPAATTEAPTQQPPATTPAQPDVSTEAIDPSMLVGTWSASRDDGSQFQLVLNQDGTFQWNFTQKEMKNDFTGHYTVHGNVLALERNDGGSLVATITPGDKQEFNFKLVGAPPTDPGLDFHQ